MRALVFPEPDRWIFELLASLGREPGGGADKKTWLYAPWALPEPLCLHGARLLAPLSKRLSAALRRRAEPPGTRLAMPVSFPLGLPLSVLAKLYANLGKTVERQMAVRFGIRRLTDEIVAARLPPGVTELILPTCGARKTLALAKRRGIPTSLVQDLPLFRQMHEDLDRAREVHPQCQFLRRYRASHEMIVRQETEWVLADRIYVRGVFASESLKARSSANKVALLPTPKIPAGRPRTPGKRGQRRLRLLFAGLATARGGIMEALAALQSLDEVELLVRVGQGSEPADLLLRPRVVPIGRNEQTQLAGLDGVLAPSLVEAYPEEVTRALAQSIPVVATGRALGCHVPTSSTGESPAPLVEIPPFDVAALRQAIVNLSQGVPYGA